MTSRIRRGRELAGLTMGQASRLLGIGLVALSDLEREKIVPTEEELRALADCYGVATSWLQGDEPVVGAATSRR